MPFGTPWATPEAGRFFPIALELGAGGEHIVVHEEAS